MSLALRIARRSLLQRPGRTIFSMLGIAMGIATVVAVVVLDHNTILGLSAPFREKGAPDLELRAPGGVAETKELAEIEGVSLAARYFQNDAVVRLTPTSEIQPAGKDRRRVHLIAMDAGAASSLGVYRVNEGRDLEPDGAAREVLIGTELAEKLSVGIGDTLWVSRLARPGKKRCEDGVLVEVDGPRDEPVEWDFQVVGVLSRELLGRRSGGMIAIVDFPHGEEIYSGVHVDRRWWARRDQGVDVERLKSTLAKSYSYELNKAAVLGQAADERAFRIGVSLAGLLALLLGLYVIFHTLSMSLTERISEVGTMHALGTTHGQVAGIFLVEATLLAGGGALIGLGGGIALARALLAVGITTLGTGKDVGMFDVPWATVLALAGLGMAIALVGSVYPLITLRRASTASVLRGETTIHEKSSSKGFHVLYALLLALVLPGLYFVVVPVVGEYTAELVSVLLGAIGFVGALVILSLVMPSVLSAVCAWMTRPLTTLWPLSGRLAARAIQDAPARIGVSASALALVTAGLVGLKGMTRSLQGEVEVWAAEAVEDKVWVRGMPPCNYDDLTEHLRQFPGVIGVEKGNARIHAPFLIMGVDVDELAGYGPCERAAVRASLAENGMILSRRLAKDLSYAVGDPIQVARRDGQVEQFRVVAITDAYGHYPFPDERMYGVIADDLMERYFCVEVDTVTEVAVRVDPDTAPEVIEAAVFDFHGGPHEMHFRTGERIRDDHVFDIQRDFVLFDVLVVLTAMLAGLGVLNGQLLAALERSKEVGVLKAIGASRRQLGGMILIESAVVGLVGGTLGAAMGAGMTPVVVGFLERLAGLSLPRVGVGMWIWVGLVGSLGVALLSALYPIWRTNRVDAVRAVRTG